MGDQIAETNQPVQTQPIPKFPQKILIIIGIVVIALSVGLMIFQYKEKFFENKSQNSITSNDATNSKETSEANEFQLFQDEFNLLPNEVKQINWDIPGVPYINIKLSWIDNPVTAATDVQINVTSPEGNFVDTTDPEIIYQKGDTYISYKIPVPTPGDWLIEISDTGASTPIPMILKGLTADVIPPIGQLVVEKEIVNSTQVTVGLDVTDPEQPIDNPLEYRLKINDEQWSDWKPVVPTFDLTLLPEGEITFVTAEFRDAAGNISRRSTVNFLVDQTPPDTSILDGSSQGKVVSDAKFTWIGTDDVIMGDAGYEYSYMLEGYDEAWTEFRSNFNYGHYNYKAVYAGLPQGKYIFKVRARDYAGNIDPTPASVSIEVVNK